MSTDVVLLTIGNEILDGRVVDTNAVTLAKAFKEYGIEVRAKISVQDAKNAIISSLGHLRAQYPRSIIICTGGLGPTADDLTRFAIAEYLNLELEAYEEERLRIQAFYAERGRKLLDKNLVQTLFPSGSILIVNEVGTASGFLIKNTDSQGNVSKVIAVPGVPREISDMLNRLICHILEIQEANIDRYRVPQPRVSRFFGIPESYLGTVVDELLKSRSELEPSKVSYRASFPEVLIKIDPDFGYDSLLDEVGKQVGLDFVVSDQGNTMVEVVANLATLHNAKIFTAESCTGGMLGSLLTELPGSSKYYYGGAVIYHNFAKKSFLLNYLKDWHVLEEKGKPGNLGEYLDNVLTQQGAVSHEMAQILAKGALDAINVKDKNSADSSKTSNHLSTNASIGVAITGIAGPDGGVMPDKPAGTFFVSLALSSGIHSFKFFFPNSRDRVRKYASWAALDLIRRALTGFNFTSWCEPSRDRELKDKFPALTEVRRLA